MSEIFCLFVGFLKSNFSLNMTDMLCNENKKGERENASLIFQDSKSTLPLPNFYLKSLLPLFGIDKERRLGFTLFCLITYACARMASGCKVQMWVTTLCCHLSIFLFTDCLAV